MSLCISVFHREFSLTTTLPLSHQSAGRLAGLVAHRFKRPAANIDRTAALFSRPESPHDGLCRLHAVHTERTNAYLLLLRHAWVEPRARGEH